MFRLLTFFALPLLGLASVQAAAADEPLPEAALTFFSNYCLDCHDSSSAKGEINLDLATADWTKPDFARLMERVHQAVSKGEMPPKKKPRPPQADSEVLLAWLDDSLVRRVPPHRTTFRRLSRAEYASTVRKTLGIQFVLPPGFPEDTLSHGFDNVAEALVLSPPLLETYAESAVLVADQFFPPPKPPLPPSRLVPVTPKDMSGGDAYGPKNLIVDGRMRLALAGYHGSTTAANFEAKGSGIYRVKVTESAFKPDAGQPMTLDIVSGTYPNLRKLKSFPITSEKAQEFTIEAPIYDGRSVTLMFADSPNKGINANFPTPQLPDELRSRLARHPRLCAALLTLHDEVAAADGKKELTLRFPPGVSFETKKVIVIKGMEEAMARSDLDTNKATKENIERLVEAIMAPDGNGNFKLHWYVESWIRQCYSEGPGIDIHALEIEGPFAPAEDDRDQLARRLQLNLFGKRPAKMEDSAWLEACVTRMLRAAYRRDAAPEETRRLLAQLAATRASGGSLDDAFHLALRTVLISPHFLYRETADRSFDSYELASRLSYMLTQGPPDEPLRTAAADGSLAQPDTLRSHATRLLASADAAVFIDSFTSQWLGTRVLPSIMPDPSLSRSFSTNHSRGMEQEANLFVAEMLRDNRPLTDFIKPDFTHVNPPLGHQLYKLPDIPMPTRQNSSTMMRVGLPRDGRLGGLLGMAGVMMATANGVDTQPVVRGKWVLENILGDAPPPPPASVPAITPDTRGAKTIRDLMKAHTSEEKCAGCHKKLDPIGFVLENYDAIGQWRDVYPIHTAGPKGTTVIKPGPPVDATATMPDGTPLKDVLDLKNYVVAHIDQFAGCLAEKLFLYGTGRVPDYAERKSLHLAANRVLKEKGGFRDLLLAVIESEAFRTR